ncbi:hypothetical protein DNU06_02400 [Putridiphycobacter roseus]|uniref:carboxypeptidase T n=1 Tax=Putridiphycobacter roseus TaxID=2219161 RepID=A0A2W1N237_9FLAO|nr:M14 family zinc carboxypeptidase [Putridiphycobacter roseus]PZE18699.1 hypothetical protein DNU06_02400 [Putridiphycobacter roseus]
MKYAFLWLWLICAPNFTYSQGNYAKVKIFTNTENMATLDQIGIPIDHGTIKKDIWFIADLSTEQIALLNQHHFQYEILIEDVKAFYKERSQNQNEGDRATCPSVTSTGYVPNTPANFHLGDYAGFYSYQEYLEELDSMVALYPNLISVRTPIDTFLTHEGRPLYWVRISDNPNSNENEKEILYTSLHHAREPISLSANIFYMWYLLENYGTSPEITFLLDESELYFVPMVNPDGYIQNETTDPNGGGMHRKNKRNIGNTNPGVDLNRNYDYFWNTSGTSNNVNGDTYAGTAPFSEPETQAIKYFCQQHNFEFASNAHSYGNLLLFPFGYATNAVANDNNYFQAFSSHQVAFNNYNAIKSSGLYAAAGDSDDWMYDGDLVNKPKIYALTPEIGNDNDGFWPAQNRILPLCQENVWNFKTLAHLPHVYGETKELDHSKIDLSIGYFHYSYQRLGLTNGPVSITMQPIQNILSMGNGQTHNINLLDAIQDSISYTLSGSLNFGDEIIYTLSTDFGGWTQIDTIIKTYGTGNLQYVDAGNNLLNWTGNWGTTNAYFVSPNTSITDSPNTDYSNNDNNNLTLNATINLNQSTYAYIQYYARWEVENNYDYAQFMVSTDQGNTWTALCGEYTNMGEADQDMDQPLYDGIQSDWVLEEINLDAYLGMSNLKFKFRLISDGFITEDGFAFDDFNIYTNGSVLALESEVMQNSFEIYPNPANDYFMVNDPKGLTEINIYTITGEFVATPVIKNGRVDISNLSNGIYIVKLLPCYEHPTSKKLVISK